MAPDIERLIKLFNRFGDENESEAINALRRFRSALTTSSASVLDLRLSLPDADLIDMIEKSLRQQVASAESQLQRVRIERDTAVRERDSLSRKLNEAEQRSQDSFSLQCQVNALQSQIKAMQATMDQDAAAAIEALEEVSRLQGVQDKLDAVRAILANQDDAPAQSATTRPASSTKPGDAKRGRPVKFNREICEYAKGLIEQGMSKEDTLKAIEDRFSVEGSWIGLYAAMGREKCR